MHMDVLTLSLCRGQIAPVADSGTDTDVPGRAGHLLRRRVAQREWQERGLISRLGTKPLGSAADELGLGVCTVYGGEKLAAWTPLA